MTVMPRLVASLVGAGWCTVRRQKHRACWAEENGTLAGATPRPSALPPRLSRPVLLNPGLLSHLFSPSPLRFASPYLKACLTPPHVCTCALTHAHTCPPACAPCALHVYTCVRVWNQRILSSFTQGTCRADSETPVSPTCWTCAVSNKKRSCFGHLLRKETWIREAVGPWGGGALPREMRLRGRSGGGGVPASLLRPP